MRTGQHKIGEGQTAEVYYPDHNDEVCLKIIHEVEAFGGVELPERYRNKRKRERPPYIPLYNEGEFYTALEGIHPHVGVPTPHMAITIEKSEEGEKYWVTEKIQALLMKRLKNSATLREVMDQNLPLPENLDIEKFFKALHEFAEMMHKKNIYHRDLHDGNVMIDLKTGKPYVIDFGRAAFASEGDAYEDVSPRQTETTVFMRDEENLANTERLLRKHLTKLKQ